MANPHLVSCCPAANQQKNLLGTFDRFRAVGKALSIGPCSGAECSTLPGLNQRDDVAAGGTARISTERRLSCDPFG
jgi:hypothetical protein